MANKFPSLEEFDSGGTATLNLDPSAILEDDFLTRERAALGDDATQFASVNDGVSFVEDNNGDLLGGELRSEEIQVFQSSFPAIESRNDSMASGGIITGSSYPQYPDTYSEEPEPETIRQWRERRDLALQEREMRSEQKKAETIKAAQQNVDDFYENYNRKKEKMIAQTQRDAEEFLASREDTSAGGTSWERIAKLVDLSGKGVKGGASGTGKEKFRELLVSLRKDEKAPGATGY